MSRDSGAGLFERVDATRINLAQRLDLLTGSDHSAAFKALIAVYGEGTRFYLPPGSTLKLPLQLASHAGGTGIPSLPSRSQLIGGGELSTVQITGWESIGNSSNYAAIEVYGANKEDVRFSDLRFVGDWVTGAGTWTNYQPAAVWVYGTAATLKRVSVVRCVFDTHRGFPLHATGAEVELFIDACAFLTCGNGVNVNSDRSIFRHNRFEASEGIEASGKEIVVDGNIFKEMVAGAVSIGGNVGSSSFPGGRVVNNVVIVCNGVGIITAESCGDVLIAGNYIEQAKNVGIQLSGGAATSGADDGIRVVDNTVVDTQFGGSSIGIQVNPRCSGALLLGNRAYNKNGTTQGYGAQLNAADIQALGNDLRGSNYAVEFAAGATNCFWGEGNTAIAGSSGIYSIYASASFAPGSVLQVAVPSSFWKPTAAARFRGVTINYSAPNGAADYKQICAKDAADAYAWRDLF